MSITDGARHNREYVRRRLAENSPEFATVLEWVVWELAHISDTEAEHAVIEPLLAAIDAAAANPDHGHQRFGDIVDEFAGKLTVHLAHEKSDGLSPIGAPLTLEEWQHFGQVHAERLRRDVAVAVPWVLDRASAQTREAVPSTFPPPVLAAFREQWEPNDASLHIWDAADEPAAWR